MQEAATQVGSAELVNYRQLLQAVLDVSTQAILCVDKQGQITLANEGAERIFGYRRSELLGLPVQLLVPERFRRAHAGHMAGYMEQPENRPMGKGLVLMGRRKDGSEFPADVLLQSLEGEQGRTVTVFVTDITEAQLYRRLQESEAQLRVSEERLRLFLEHAPVGIAICDEQMRYLELNSHWMRDCPWGEKLLGKSHYECYPEARERWEEIFEKVLAGESFASAEDRLVRRDGVVKWLQWAAMPWRDGQGRVSGLFLLHVDLTAHKETEARLRASEERLRQAAEVAEFGMLDYDLKGERANYWSETLYRLAGLPEGSEVNEETLESLLHPEERERFADALREALEPDGESKQMMLDFRVVRRDKGLRWWRITSQTWLEGEGEQRRAVRWIGAVLDITERVLMEQRLEEALRWSDEERSSIVQAAPIAVVTYDAEGVVTSWNPAAESMFGYPENAVKGKPDPTLPAGENGGLQEMLAAVLRGERYQGEGKRVKADGSPIEVRLAVAPLHGNRDGVVALTEDITSRKKAEAELVQVRAALQTARDEEARRIAQELHDDVTQRLSMVAVDLGRLAGGAEPEGKLGEELRLLQDKVIEISQAIREVSHQLHPTVLDDLGLENALEELCEEFAVREEMPVVFLAEVGAKPLPAPVARCLYRVAQEALHNVSKYARARKVEVRLVQKGALLELRVKDEGDGFQLARVRAGLGLHSMRERVELLRGRLVIESTPGKGTLVMARVPLTN